LPTGVVPHYTHPNTINTKFFGIRRKMMHN